MLKYAKIFQAELEFNNVHVSIHIHFLRLTFHIRIKGSIIVITDVTLGECNH